MLPAGIAAHAEADMPISQPDITTTAALLTIFIIVPFRGFVRCCRSLIWLLPAKTQPGRFIDCSDRDLSHSAVDYRDTAPAGLFLAAENNSNSLGLGEAYSYQQPVSQGVEGVRSHTPAELLTRYE
jgi:hypothetical protein